MLEWVLQGRLLRRREVLHLLVDIRLYLHRLVSCSIHQHVLFGGACLERLQCQDIGGSRIWPH